MIPVLVTAVLTLTPPAVCHDLLRQPWRHPFIPLRVESVSRFDTVLVETLQLRHGAACLWPREFYRAYHHDEATPDTTMEWRDVLEAEIVHEVLRLSSPIPEIAADILGELSMPAAVRDEALLVLDTVPLTTHIATAYARTLCQLGLWRMAIDPDGSPAVPALDLASQSLFEDVRSVMFRRRDEFEALLRCTLEDCFNPMFAWRVVYWPIVP